jgi:pyroglutamyl-peptidase
MSVLVTGFGRYGNQTSNPSEFLARALDGQRIAGETITGVVLPVATAQVGGVLATAIGNVRPRIVIALGVAPGRTAPSLERVAINVRDFPIPDTDGAQPVDEPVVAGGPDAYLTGLPVKMVLSAWRTAGLPGYISNTAGTYVCNQVFYLVSHQARQEGFRAGFIHLPALPAPDTATVPIPSMSLEPMEEAIRAAVAVTAGHDGPDLSLVAGAVS